MREYQIESGDHRLLDLIERRPALQGISRTLTIAVALLHDSHEFEQQYRR